MFINFSNHPSKLWAEDERNAALQYGTIEIWPFRRFRKAQSNHWLSQWS